MIHQVNHDNAALYAAQLRAMHRHRREVFVDKLGWDLTVADDGGEYDGLDDERAVYLMALDRAGEIECCVRLRPTDDGSILGLQFPEAITAGAPASAPATWEMSRYYARGAGLTDDGFVRRSQLRLAALEAAHAAGATRIVAPTEIIFWEPVMRSGWTVRALGLPFSYGADAGAVAFEIACQPQDVQRLRERLKLASPILNLPAMSHSDIEPHELEQLLASLDFLSSADRGAITRIVRQVAHIESVHGEGMALAVAERMEHVLADRVAA